MNADIIETTRNIVLPSSEINSGGRETPVFKISKLLQILQNVARCCKVENLSKLKSENRETATIELSVVNCPRKGKSHIFRNFHAMLQTPRFLQLLQKPVTNTQFLSLLFCFCQISKQKPKSEKFFREVPAKSCPSQMERLDTTLCVRSAHQGLAAPLHDEFFVLDEL